MINETGTNKETNTRIVVFLNGYPIIDVSISDRCYDQPNKSIKGWYKILKCKLDILLRVTCVQMGEDILTLPDEVPWRDVYIPGTHPIDGRCLQVTIGVKDSLSKPFLKSFSERVSKHLNELTEYWHQSTD